MMHRVQFHHLASRARTSSALLLGLVSTTCSVFPENLGASVDVKDANAAETSVPSVDARIDAALVGDASDATIADPDASSDAGSDSATTHAEAGAQLDAAIDAQSPCSSVTLVADKDTFIDEADAEASPGGADSLRISGLPGAEVRSLLGFSIAAAGLPTGTLAEATLELYLTATVVEATELELYRVQSVPPRSWHEKKTSWLKWNTGPSWTSPGGDFEPMVSDAVTVASGSSAGSPIAFDVAADVATWLANPGSNHGWFMTYASGSTDPIELQARDGVPNANDPALRLTFCP